MCLGCGLEPPDELVIRQYPRERTKKANVRLVADTCEADRESHALARCPVDPFWDRHHDYCVAEYCVFDVARSMRKRDFSGHNGAPLLFFAQHPVDIWWCDRLGGEHHVADGFNNLASRRVRPVKNDLNERRFAHRHHARTFSAFWLTASGLRSITFIKSS